MAGPLRPRPETTAPGLPHRPPWAAAPRARRTSRWVPPGDRGFDGGGQSGRGTRVVLLPRRARGLQRQGVKRPWTRIAEWLTSSPPPPDRPSPGSSSRTGSTCGGCWPRPLQLEHMIMCQYLFAEFSLKDGVADGLTPEQAEAVDRWRKTLQGIAIEEMLHIALVANLMTAIGAAPTFGRPNFPQRSGLLPGRCATRPVAVRRAGASSISCSSNAPRAWTARTLPRVRRRRSAAGCRCERRDHASRSGIHDHRAPLPGHRRRAAGAVLTAR